MTKKEKEKQFEEWKELIFKEEQKGNIVFKGIDGLYTVKLDDFIKQPAEGMLYDLNRSPEVVLTLLNEKWVNDYAVGLVIKKLKSLVEESIINKKECQSDTPEKQEGGK